jgi:DNA-binding response OmpR family regulator
MKQKILIIEDDPVTSGLLSAYFTKAKYQVANVCNGEEMWESLSQNPINLILMDINLPGEDGVSLTKSLRFKFNSDICIILVTSRGEDIDKIIGLESGADDYVTKPFNERELLVRVKNLLRRTSGMQKEVNTLNHTFHGWTFNVEMRRLTSPNGELIHITNGEFLLLSAFINSPGRVLNRTQLLEAVSCREWMPNNRTIDVMVNRLRQKIEITPKQPEILVTVHGVGYQFVSKE